MANHFKESGGSDKERQPTNTEREKLSVYHSCYVKKIKLTTFDIE